LLSVAIGKNAQHRFPEDPRIMKISVFAGHLFLIIVVFALAVILINPLVRLAISCGMATILIAASFAIVGRGNRLLWLLLCPVVAAVLLGMPYVGMTWLMQTGYSGNIVFLILMFAMVPLLPASFLWIANLVRLRRNVGFHAR
jgi:hypothetical protein